MDNSNRLIEKIQQQDIKPLPRWRFTVKNSIFWSLFVICVFFGALAFSVILFAIQQADFDITRHFSHSAIELILVLVPIFWIISLIVLLIMAIISIKNSKKGYRFTSPALVGFSAGLSILIGTLFFVTGGAGRLEHAFSSRVSHYESIEERKSRVWSMPEEGFLSGTIISTGEHVFELKDLQGKLWVISYDDAGVVPSVQIADGEKIKLTGTITSDNEFRADLIRPWGGYQRRYHGGRGNN